MTDSFRMRTLLAVSFGVFAVSLSPLAAQATTLSIAGIRPDAEQYAAWSTRFTACGDFFHEEEGLALQEYGAVFNERVRLDVASQLGSNRALTFEQEAAMAPQATQQYSKELGHYLDTQRALDLEQASDVTQGGCDAMERAFAAYYGPFKERVARMRDGALPSGQ